MTRPAAEAMVPFSTPATVKRGSRRHFNGNMSQSTGMSPRSNACAVVLNTQAMISPNACAVVLNKSCNMQGNLPANVLTGSLAGLVVTIGILACMK